MVELVSNRFVTEQEEHFLELRLEQYALKVLDQWPGIPEEMGATLETATARIDSWLQGDNRRAAVQRKAAARRLLCRYQGGRQLIDLELRLQNMN